LGLNLPFVTVSSGPYPNCPSYRFDNGMIQVSVATSNGGNGFYEVPRDEAAAYDTLIVLKSNHGNLAYMIRTTLGAAFTQTTFNVNVLRVRHTSGISSTHFAKCILLSHG